MSVLPWQGETCLSYPQQVLMVFSRNWMRAFNRHDSTWWKHMYKISPPCGKIPLETSGLQYCWPVSHPISFLPFTVGSCIVFLTDTAHASTFSVTGDCKAGISLEWIVRTAGNGKHLGVFLNYIMDICCQCELWLLVTHCWIGILKVCMLFTLYPLFSLFN